MTENKRILLNFISTYGRSVYALALGLFSARWILAALGKSDYGLFGVVGSIIIVIGFLNGVLGGAVARYYAYAIGEAQHMNSFDARDHLLRWFNASIAIHTIVPLILCVIGLPVGLYTIENWLVVPEGRLFASKCVFIFSLCNAFLHMISVPYISMYRAKQLIAELSLWGVVQTTLTFIGAYFLLHVSYDRLIVYGMLVTIVPGLILILQVLRASRQFDVCRIHIKYLFDRTRIFKILSYSFWEIFACGGDVIRAQGTAFLINRNFGSEVNASWSLSSQVSSHTTALSSAMIGALAPALTTAAGANESERVEKLAFATCRFGAFFILLFSVPLIIDMEYVLDLWLIDSPPPYSVELCRCVLIALVCHKLGIGHHMAILADGHVAPLLMTTGIVSALTIFVIWGFITAGYGAVGTGISFEASYSTLTIVRVLFAKYQLGLRLRSWVSKVFLPIILISFFSTCAGYCVFNILSPSFSRVIIIAIVTLIVSSVAGWYLVCEIVERKYILDVLVKFRKKICKD